VSADTEPAGESPVVTVTRGRPAPAELAAVLTVLLAIRTAAGHSPAAESGPSAQWADRSRSLAGIPRPGPGAWRASALPS
jgi:hypothetical protein